MSKFTVLNVIKVQVFLPEIIGSLKIVGEIQQLVQKNSEKIN